MTRNRVVAIDIETLGLELTDSIFEVAIVVADDGETVGDKSWWMPVDDLPSASMDALRINRYYERFPEDMTPRREVAMEVARWTADATLVGCNVAFDAPRVERFLRLEGFAPAWKYRLFDVEAAAAAVLGIPPPLPGASQLAAALGVPVPEDGHHTALGDARVAMRMFDAIYARTATAPLSQPAPAATVPAVPTSASADAPPARPARREAVDEGKVISRGVPRGMPADGDEPTCEVCTTPVDLDFAQKSWTRHRRILCRADFATAKV